MKSNINPSQRSMQLRLAAHLSWANTLDPKSRTAKARAAANGRFEKKARELHPDATPEQIARVAEHLRKAYYTAMAMKSVAARRAKAASE